MDICGHLSLTRTVLYLFVYFKMIQELTLHACDHHQYELEIMNLQRKSSVLINFHFSISIFLSKSTVLGGIFRFEVHAHITY